MANGSHPGLQHVAGEIREHGDPVLVALARADNDLAIIETDILDPQPAAFLVP